MTVSALVLLLDTDGTIGPVPLRTRTRFEEAPAPTRRMAILFYVRERINAPTVLDPKQIGYGSPRPFYTLSADEVRIVEGMIRARHPEALAVLGDIAKRINRLAPHLD